MENKQQGGKQTTAIKDQGKRPFAALESIQFSESNCYQ